MQKCFFSLDVESYSDLYYAGASFNENIVLNSGIEQYLSILERNNWKGIAFLLCDKLDRISPELLSQLQKHCQIGLHGCDHRLPIQMSESEFSESLRIGKEILEDRLSRPCEVYRAPCFAIDSVRLVCVAEAGFKYDSSLISATGHKLYGSVDNKVLTVNHDLTDPGRFYVGDMKVFPMNVFRLGFIRIPYSGGGWFRLLRPATVGMLHRYAKNNFFNIYSHPFEFSKVAPLDPEIDCKSRFRSLVGRKKFASNLEAYILKNVSENNWQVTVYG